MSSCSVQFDNYNGQFYAGTVITGRVICIFNSPKSIRGITLKLKGEESNRWTRSESYYDTLNKRQETRTVVYSGYNRFLYYEQILAGAGEFETARFEYPFSLQLPFNIPSTYQGQYGGVYFTVKAHVNRPSFKSDYKDSKQIVVASPINFNNFGDALPLAPVAYSDDKKLCCSCSSDLITMQVHLEKEAFVTGEMAKVKVVVTNMSNQSIESVRVELIMKVISEVTHPRTDRRTNYELLAITKDTGVGAHGERTYDFRLQIPQSVIVPNFNLCKLFNKTTKLRVTAILPGCHGNMEIKTYVTIGHIPICEPNDNHSVSNSIAPPAYQPFDSVTASPYQGEPGYGMIGFTVAGQVRPGPSAPSSEGEASAPSKKELGYTDFAVVDLAPPPYSEAVSSSETPNHDGLILKINSEDSHKD